MINQGIKDQVQYKVTDGLCHLQSFDVISFITTVLSILPLISCGGWGNSVLPSALQKG